MNIDILKGAFRETFQKLLEENECEVDPAVWNLKWGINIEHFGTGKNAIKYLGAYVCRTAIGDSRILKVTATHVTYQWKDRENGCRIQTDTITGVEFVKRYLRHVLPTGLRSIRYYGHCHPAAKKKRIRIAFHTGVPLDAAAIAREAILTPEVKKAPDCPCCEKPMILQRSFTPFGRGGSRAPPAAISAFQVPP